MNKRILILSLALILLLCGGCSLAVTEEKAAAYPTGDKLIGVLVTTKPLDLFDVERYFNENAQDIINGREIDNSDYIRRIYATRVKEELTGENGGKSYVERFVFESIDGISYLAPTLTGADGEIYVSNTNDEGLSDGHTAIYSSNTEEKITLTGTVYVGPGSGIRVYYINPVYQTEDEQIYVTGGSGISSDWDWEATTGAENAGGALSSTLTESHTETVNGESKTFSCSITISIAPMLPAEKATVLQMDKNNAVVSRTEFQVDAMPEELEPDADCEFILLEMQNGDKTYRRLYQPGDETLDVYTLREDGICVKHFTKINWAE